MRRSARWGGETKLQPKQHNANYEKSPEFVQEGTGFCRTPVLLGLGQLRAAVAQQKVCALTVLRKYVMDRASSVTTESSI